MTEDLEIRLTARTEALKQQLSEAAGALDGLGASGSTVDRALSAGLARMHTALTAAQKQLRQDGEAVARSLGEGMDAARGGVESAARSIEAAAQIRSAGAAAQAKSAGAAVGQGFANGIGSKKSAVAAAAGRLVDAALAKIRGALEIHSPSRVTFAIGENFSAGFGQGIAGGADDARAAVARLARESAQGLEAVGGAAGAVGTAGAGRQAAREDEAVDITIPLMIDGEKLGEACIRGINRVTRRAGRILLEI